MDSDDEDEKKHASATRGAAAAASSTAADSSLFDESKHSFRGDDEDEDDGDDQSLSDRYLAATPSGPSAHPSLSSLGGASASVDAVQRSAQLVLLDVPAGLQLGIDYWSFRVGERFRGMKLLPPGPHFLWFSSMIIPGAAGGADQAPRVGCFMYLSAGQVVVKRWDKVLECLVSLRDEDEESRYIAGARRFDFDSGQGTYPLNASSKWTRLSNHITKELVHRLEPVDGGLISSFEVRKYTTEDKKAGAHAEPMGGKDARKAKTAGAGEAAALPAATAAVQSTATAAVQIEDANDMRDEAPSDAATSAVDSTASATAASSLSNFTSKPSTSFYSRVPSIAAFVERAHCTTPEEKASLVSALHLDSSPLLEEMMETYYPESVPTAAAASATATASGAAPSSSQSLSLLGEFQFAFIAFLIGQDLEGFEAWKGLVVLLASSFRAMEQRYALYEAWLITLLAQVAELPRDWFVDPLSGDNFLGPILQRLFDNVEQARVPASLGYAARELATLIAKRFKPDPRRGLPRFKREDETTRALKEAAAAAAAATASPMDTQSQPPGGLLSEEQQRKQLLARLQAEAEDDEYAPTIAED